MNFFSIVVWGYFIIAGYLSYILLRDWRTRGSFCFCHPVLPLTAAAILALGGLIAFDAHYIEPWTIQTKEIKVPLPALTRQIKIAWLADLQAGNHKKAAWVEKVVKRVDDLKPDIVILGGDVIDNAGAGADETTFLEPLRPLAQKYPTFYIPGNHEYGIGNFTRGYPEEQTGDRSDKVMEKITELDIKVLRNELSCPTIKNQFFCLFGADDIWGAPHPNFMQLELWDRSFPIIFLTHNPDGITRWPMRARMPELALAGHSHGGQIFLPLFGPVGKAGIELGNQYYRGLNYYNNAPIYTSVGLGESGGAMRFCTLPEISLITLVPKAKE